MTKHNYGMLVISELHILAFMRMLVAYYEGRNKGEIPAFIKGKCWRRF